MDIAGPWPADSNGLRFVLISVCEFSGYLETEAVATINAEDVKRFIEYRLILRHGCPEKIRTDRGRQFIAGSVVDFLESRGIKLIHTSSYHPQGNGKAERAVRSLKSVMDHYYRSDRKNWSAILPYATFCVNTALSSAKGFSPFFILHGREPALPADLLLERAELESNGRDKLSWLQRANAARELTQLYLEGARARIINQGEGGQTVKPFVPGDLVLLEIPASLRKSRKIRYKGPFIVISMTNANNYVIGSTKQNLNGKPTWSDTVHVNRLKRFCGPAPSVTSDDDSIQSSQDDEIKSFSSRDVSIQ